MRYVRWAGGQLLPVFLVVLGLLSVGSAPALAEEDKCGEAANPIVCENALPGDPPSDWQVNGVGNPAIEGYATSMSVNVGQTESFKIETNASSYHINILRLGYYNGDGARRVASNIKPTATLPQKQPACLTKSTTGLIDCGNWGVSASWTVPSNAVSGVYIAELVLNETSEDSQIPFVVRNDSSHSEILLQTSDATWEAYNNWGGNSLYRCTVACPEGEPEAYKGADAVSYNRPWEGSFEVDGGASYLWYAEYQMMYWMEENGYNVSYTSESEVDHNGALLKNHKLFISSGHDEYWSEGQRTSVESALAAGVNLAFFSGNEIFWKTRWGPSTEGTSTPYRTLTSYKETHYNAPVDPEDPPTWTGSWRDPRFSPPANGGRPENALTGQLFLVNAGTSDITVPSQYSKLRLWKGTAASTLRSGQSLTLAPGAGTLGYEWDEDVDNGFRPGGEFDLSSTTVSGLQTFNDYGSRLSEGTTATHHLTLHKAPSGALVFGAGTVQWSWGLANVNAWESETTEPGNKPPDPNLEQATVNLFAEMGAQPGSLITGLVPAGKSTDTTPPTSTITSPAQGATLQDGSAVTIAGTAADAGGGVVAGVEVSTDGGTTWHPATLTTPAEQSVKWTYSWAAHD
ncbi:MAG: N,N-dimethylformamidase beta subunit family domain-containing protein, partial [Solirubrobacteraceae bacterium]